MKLLEKINEWFETWIIVIAIATGGYCTIRIIEYIIGGQ